MQLKSFHILSLYFQIDLSLSLSIILSLTNVYFKGVLKGPRLGSVYSHCSVQERSMNVLNIICILVYMLYVAKRATVAEPRLISM